MCYKYCEETLSDLRGSLPLLSTRYYYLPDAVVDNSQTPPGLQEFFKMAPDVVERRTKGLEMYITTIIRRFPDMLESSHLDRYIARTRMG